ncbi:TRAP transporter substrate-binding protein DctP [Tessaracoccus oleiagri]|uniref:TRAP-type C4-dicarboxylate transport system, substrate-binding protein n=1 Tax=Tessaracoccus oleiagri TaxID=686624 RepID=A0A1G9HCK0_9ACTN|nr:TRAP transporter substrate-binding protein DctP [Tessaracoccus oleiagri]SDL10639.1 TRAP-type C4-dicarboxylate transport system, substrate-binding protein [Tessaracoccus oleiagri]
MTSKKPFSIVAALGAAAALALTACGGGNADADSAAGETVTLNSATMVLPKTPNAPVQNWIYDQLEERSEGRIQIDRTEPESICAAAEIAECVRDGRADIGVSIADYTPQLFPTLTVVSIPFMVDNSQALMQSLHGANESNEAAQAKWDEVGLKMMAAWGPGKLILGSNEPMESMDDVAGVRYRVTGAFLQRAFEAAGANVIALTAGETYEGIERGIADAVAWTMDGAVDYKLMEQLSHWTDPNIGHYTAFSMWMNADVYEGLPDDLKAIVDEVIADVNSGEGMKAFNGVTEPQCDALLDFANTESVTAWDEAATEEWKNAVQDQLIEQWISDAEGNGLTDARGYLEAYQQELAAAADTPDLVEDPVTACVARANG